MTARSFWSLVVGIPELLLFKSLLDLLELVYDYGPIRFDLSQLLLRLGHLVGQSGPFWQHLANPFFQQVGPPPGSPAQTSFGC
jgi:hypothetical protein